MVPLSSLLIPIAVSAVLVFIASSVIHMALTYHQHDYRGVPSEDDVQAALRPFNIPPGDYMLPRAGSMAALKSPAFLEKLRRGPVVIMTVTKGGFEMGPQLVQWFAFCLVVSLFAGYLASRALGPGAPYLTVSQIVSSTAFMGYGLGAVPQSIWYRKSWAATGRTLFDALVYGFITGGAFGWLWPQL
jgi:hypothetical protein